MTRGDEEGGTAEKKAPFISTIEYYDKMYARSCDGNDQKAIRTFRDFESKEKLRRLQAELQWVKEGKVDEKVCDRVIGKKRKSRYESYEHWAELMLLWAVAKR